VSVVGRYGVLPKEGGGGPDDGLADGVGELLPGQAFSEAGGDDLPGDLVTGHAAIIGAPATLRLPKCGR